MFIVRISYIVPLEVVDRFLADHVEWLHKFEKSGMFLVYGRLVPRTGGVIVARAGSRDELEEAIASDPFRIHGVGTYEITEFAENRSFAEKAAALGLAAV
jgi:uncharacterized protein YciI